MTGRPIGLTALAAATTPTSEPVQDLAARAGLSEADRATLRENGLDRLPVAGCGLVELVGEVIDGLAGQGWEPGRCPTVVFTHSLELSADVARALDTALRRALPRLTGPPVMLTGRPCSVVHLGVELAARRAAARPGDETLVLGADVAPDVSDRFFFGSAMGDAAVGLVVGGAPRVGAVLATVSTWLILAGDGALSDPGDIARFRAQNPTAIRATIAASLACAGLDWSGLTAIVPHTPYGQIWDTVAELCRFPRDRILDQGLSRTGHLNSNDVVVHLIDAIRAGRLRDGDVAALVSPGFGGTRGCTLLRISGGAA